MSLFQQQKKALLVLVVIPKLEI